MGRKILNQLDKQIPNIQTILTNVFQEKEEVDKLVSMAQEYVYKDAMKVLNKK